MTTRATLTVGLVVWFTATPCVRVGAEPPASRARSARELAEAGETGEARSVWIRELAEAVAAGDAARARELRADLGSLAAGLGDLRDARRWYDAALDGIPASAAADLHPFLEAEYGLLDARAGRPAQALARYASALALHREAGAVAPDTRATVLDRMGNLRRALGDPTAALALHDEALVALGPAAEGADGASIRLNRASDLADLGRISEAKADLERSRDELRAAGRRDGHAIALGNLSHLAERAGDLKEAVALRRVAIPILEDLGDAFGLAEAHGNLSRLLDAHGDRDGALRGRRIALSTAEAAGAEDLISHHLGELARLLVRPTDADTTPDGRRAAEDRLAEALSSSKRATELTSRLLRGLAEGTGAVAREAKGGAWRAGCDAAIRLGRTADAFALVEAARAAALLESLSTARIETPLPPALAEDLAVARAEQAAAAWALTRAREGGAAEAVAAATVRAAKAADARRRAIEGAQAHARHGLLGPLPETATLDSIAARLSDDQAFVSFVVLPDRAFAFVAATARTRFVDLGSSAPITTLVAALRKALSLSGAGSSLPDRGRQTPPERPTNDSRGSEILESARRLGAALLGPLELPPSVRTLLVSPDDELASIPTALLVEGRSLGVSIVPSATIQQVLRARAHSSNEAVLALGDPEVDGAAATARSGASVFVRGEALTRLPGSRAEALSVAGRTGDVALLGPRASESGLLAELAAPRDRGFRALHFACHGLARDDVPLLSALALTPTATDDGFLTAQEVTQLRLDVELVALAACESALGRRVADEGPQSLVRAFHVAGAPRVLASLWRVDDAATKELMGTYYELWRPAPGRPRVGAAEALRRAQDRIRADPRWAHPRFWAAWVLFGLPD